MVLDHLEGDGISEAFVSLLWTKDELGYGPSVHIPDSIVYKFGQATCWYFTGVDGKVKKKNKSNVVNIKIEEAFNKKATSDIVGYYISECGEETVIEYFDRAGLREFLYERWKENSGILQRFVEPKGMYNGIIRAIWSPKVCLLERRQNKKQLHDQRYGLYERAVTYEGPEHFSEAAPLRGCTLPNQLQGICEAIETHVAEVSFRKHRIARMVLNFKVDARDRVWFLWSSSIRLADERDVTQASIGAETLAKTAVNIDTIIRIPDHVRLRDEPNHSASCGDASVKSSNNNKRNNSSSSSSRAAIQPPLMDKWCASCGAHAPSNQFHPVQYKAVMAHFEQVVEMLKADAATGDDCVKWPPDDAVISAAGGVGFGALAQVSNCASNRKWCPLKEIDLVVPPVLRAAHPRLTVDAYRKYKRDPLFLYKTSDVCEDCFLAYAELATLPRGWAHQRAVGEVDASSQANKAKRDEVDQKAKSKEKKPRSRPEPPASWMPIEPPSLPPTIFAGQASGTIDDAGCFSAMENPSFQTPGGSAGWSASPAPAPESASPAVEDLVRKREEAFFRDLYDNDSTQLPRGHPLAHMVTSHAILKTISKLDLGSGQRPKPKKSPYLHKPVLVEDRVRPGQQHSSSTPAHNSIADGLAQPSAGSPLSLIAKPRSDAAQPSASAVKHRQFLMNTLVEVQQHLATPNALQNWKDDANARGPTSPQPAPEQRSVFSSTSPQ